MNHLTIAQFFSETSTKLRCENSYKLHLQAKVIFISVEFIHLHLSPADPSSIYHHAESIPSQSPHLQEGNGTKGDKMEAIASGQTALRVNNELRTGHVYYIRDVIGIVVYVSPVRFLPSTHRNTPCREVVLMNNRWEFICLRIWDKHVSRHMMKWRRAERDMSILSAILFEVSTAQFNKENEVPSVNKKNEVPSVNKENEVPYKDDEWLRRNGNYQRQSIPMPFQGPEIIPTDVIATYCTQESHGGPSALCQLESTPAVKGDTARDKENLVPDDNDALHMQLPHMSSQRQGSLVTVNKETEVPLAHKENEVHSQDDEWLRRNDNYQMQSIPMLLQGQEIIPTDIVDMENYNSNEPTSSRIQPQPVVDSTEKKKKRERERYAQMNIDSKNELLAKRHATYQQKRLLAEHIEKRRAKDRLLYAAMSPKKKHSKKARQELRRNSLNEESIAMENPCWIPEVVHTPDTQGYIPTCDWHIPEFSETPIYIEPILEQMSGEVTPDIYFSNKSRRKHVTPGERHALLGLRNEAFYANSKKHAISSADENPSMSMEGVNGFETPTQSAVVNNGEDEGVILEEDSEDEEGYMFVGQGNLIMF
ncbi:hypothetical protein ACQ4PT_002406 [Festuca glaucescens]